MEKSIRLENENINYQIRSSSRARNMRLSIYADGRFIVTKPHRLSDRAIEHFIVQKSAWILSKIKKIGPIRPLISPAEDRKKYLQHKEEARRLVEERVGHFNKIYGFKFNRIAIRNQNTCWGSCSRRANLNFNYKILFLPEKLANYIIIHELCHLKELNHSRRFWNLLAMVMPDYLEIRRELKKFRS